MPDGVTGLALRLCFRVTPIHLQRLEGFEAVIEVRNQRVSRRALVRQDDSLA